LKNFQILAYCKMKKQMEDICYQAVEPLHYTHYVAAYLEDNFPAVRTGNNSMNICHHISYTYLKFNPIANL